MSSDIAMLPVVSVIPELPDVHLQTDLAIRWLVAFLRDELIRRRDISRAVLGLSGGVDSAVVAALCVRALGADAVTAYRLPYRSSSPSSLSDAQAVADQLGIRCETIDITQAVDGYLAFAPDADARRRGNVMARTRMLALFDQSARLHALPIGTGNKTERLLGYYTWHADDAPPVNPIGDLWKTQVWQLARALDIPLAVIEKAPSADLEANQTDEADLGISYALADRILALILQGYSDDAIVARGAFASDIATVRRRLESTHWKRHLPTNAMVSGTAINEFYLRPVDY
jgi:NAD+ synthetase